MLLMTLHYDVIHLLVNYSPYKHNSIRNTSHKSYQDTHTHTHILVE